MALPSRKSLASAKYPIGLSLVEVLIVLAIIAIVSALGVQGLARLRDDARVNTVQARIKQLNIAKEQYIAEWGRLEAENNWSTAALPSPNPSNFYLSDIRYNMLKRYIERPQYTLGDVVPDLKCTISTPLKVHDLYFGAVTLDSPFNNSAGKAVTLISVTDH